MKRLLTLLVLALVVFVVVYRQRLFLRDPLGMVRRNGVKLGGTTVMINYSNDVLLDDGSGGTRRLYLLQHGNDAAGVPTALLKCIQGMACMTDADHAGVALLPGSRHGRPGASPITMTDKEVTFLDEDGVAVQVSLR